jgi:tRNA G10  N-methylase Trm11
MIVKSISYDEQEILKNILNLHCTSKDIDLDPTYSIGNFYKNGLKKPRLKFDIFPQAKDVVMASADNLPLTDECINTIMFDPPFLATKGKSLKDKNDNNKINKRFSVFSDEKKLHKFYVNSLKEFYRVLRFEGTLIFKCQDKVSSQKQYFSHCYIYNEAIKIGFYAKDLFILLAKNRIVADWQKANQQHARKYHSYFWVFKKITTKNPI